VDSGHWDEKADTGGLDREAMSERREYAESLGFRVEGPNFEGLFVLLNPEGVPLAYGGNTAEVMWPFVVKYLPQPVPVHPPARVTHAGGE
jgi:hypothetical protein